MLVYAIIYILSLAALVFLFCYSIFCIGCAVDVLTQKWGDSYREYGPEYTKYTVDIKDISGDKITGSVKSEVTRDDEITLAGCGRFLLWITYFIWSIPAYLILRFKFRVIFSTMKNRRAAGVCQYCGGEFRKYCYTYGGHDKSEKACQDCREKKDYIRIIPRKK